MAKRELSISVRQAGEITVVRPQGAVDASNVREFRETVEPLCRADRPLVLLDGDKLSYLSSTSLGLLYEFHRLCAAHGGRFALCELWTKVDGILRLLKLDTILTIYGSRTEALERMADAGRGEGAP